MTRLRRTMIVVALAVSSTACHVQRTLGPSEISAAAPTQSVLGLGTLEGTWVGQAASSRDGSGHMLDLLATLQRLGQSSNVSVELYVKSSKQEEREFKGVGSGNVSNIMIHAQDSELQGCNVQAKGSANEDLTMITGTYDLKGNCNGLYGAGTYVLERQP